MNDRLGDLGDDVPAWAVESNGTSSPVHNASTMGSGSVELGTMSSSSPTHASTYNSTQQMHPAPSWMNASDDFQGIQSNTTNSQVADDVENQNAQKRQESEQIMAQFFSHVDHIKSTIDLISSSTRRIKQMDEKTKLAVSESEEKKMSEEIKTLIQRTNIEAKKGKSILSLLREENKKYEANRAINVSDLRWVSIPLSCTLVGNVL